VTTAPADTRSRPDTAIPDVLAPLPIDLPPVERHARMPAGFAAVAATAGIKPSGRPDLALIVATNGPASAAGVFTQNLFAAAPVRLSKAHLRSTGGDGTASHGRALAVIATSGSANAATGTAGDADQVEIAKAVARVLGRDGQPELTLHLSTGIIGTRLPVDKVTAALEANASRLAATDAALEAAAVALRTTDSVTKVATTTVELPDVDGRPVTITVSGIAKGVGMIHPQMATMLSVILTDARAEPATLHDLLTAATSRTWNQLTVDGDTSTNDTVFVLASGASAAAPVEQDREASAALGAAIEAVARDLARQQAADGEGAASLITCQVSGARTEADARAVARSVVASALVKTAVHGRDANWGRIAGAAGNARVDGALVALDPDRTRIGVAGHLVYDRAPIEFDRAAARAAMASDEVLVRLDLGLGDGTGEAFGCDLTEEYVRENSEYTT